MAYISGYKEQSGFGQESTYTNKREALKAAKDARAGLQSKSGGRAYCKLYDATPEQEATYIYLWIESPEGGFRSI